MKIISKFLYIIISISYIYNTMNKPYDNLLKRYFCVFLNKIIDESLAFCGKGKVGTATIGGSLEEVS